MSSVICAYGCFLEYQKSAFCLSLNVCPCAYINAALSVSVSVCPSQRAFALYLLNNIESTTWGRKKGHFTEFSKQGLTRDEALLTPTDPENKQHCKNHCRQTYHPISMLFLTCLFYKVVSSYFLFSACITITYTYTYMSQEHGRVHD